MGSPSPHESDPGPDATATERTALLVIRAWTEQGSSDPLRAEIRLSTDVSAGFERTLTRVRADEVGAIVQRWLASIISGAQP